MHFLLKNKDNKQKSLISLKDFKIFNVYLYLGELAS